jgi:hypothetical protein
MTEIHDSNPRVNRIPERIYKISSIVLAGLVAVYGIERSADFLKSPKREFERQFTGANDCLDNTPFDPSEGAIVNVNSVNDHDILTVITRDANLRKPSFLVFSVEYHGLSHPSLQVTDSETDDYLYSVNCSE